MLSVDNIVFIHTEIIKEGLNRKKMKLLKMSMILIMISITKFMM